MEINLSDKDVDQMPEPLRTRFLNWLTEHLKTKSLNSAKLQVFQQSSEPKALPTQLSFDFADQTLEEKTESSRVRLTELFDAGITKRGMALRVKLKREIAKKRGRDYINGLEISATGTIIFNGHEFDKPSPLAAQINGSSANGWEYIEIKKNDKWILLDELREIWRKTNDQGKFAA